MELVLVGVGALALFGAGVGLGFALRRSQEHASFAARLAAAGELSALTEQLKNREQQLTALRSEAVDCQRRERAAQERLEVVSTGLARAEASREAADRELAERKQELLGRHDALELEKARAESLSQLLSVERSAVARQGADLEAATRRYDEATRELDALSAQSVSVDAELAVTQVELARARSQLEASEKAAVTMRDQLHLELAAVTHQMLDEKGAVMLERSQQSLETLLTPLRERLKEFEEKVEKTYDQDNRDRASLLQQLKHLQEAQLRLHHDADSLSRALSGEARSRGEWGEVVLERLFETAGLTEGREYKLQVSHTDEEGAGKRPDAVVYLPNGRAVVVDSKCPLAAFMAAAAAPSDEEREAKLDQHLESVRSEIRALSEKRYQELLGERTLDFVLMFIPNEAAFHAAIHRAPGLYEEAFRKGVHLCSPGTLLAMLQVIAQVWRSEKQTTHARQLADEAARLLDKLSAFQEAMELVGRRLASATTSWEDAKKKLLTGRGSVRRHAHKMVELGARLPQNDRAPRLVVPGGEIEPGDEEREDEREDDEPQGTLELTP